MLHSTPPLARTFVLSLLVLTALVTDAAGQVNLTGTWKGIYQYQDECLNYRGEETLVLTDDNGQITGDLTDKTISPVEGIIAKGKVTKSSLPTLKYEYDFGLKAEFRGGLVDDNTLEGRIFGNPCSTKGAVITLIRGNDIQCVPQIQTTFNQGIDAEDINDDFIVDVVAYRTTILKVSVTLPQPCANSDPFSLTVKFPGMSPLPLPHNTVAQWRTNPTVEVPLSADKIGPGKGQVTFDSNKVLLGPPFSFEAKRVRQINYGYYNVNYLPFSQTTQFNKTVNDSGDFIRGVFPVSDLHLLNTPAALNGKYTPSQVSIVPFFGVQHDSARLWLLSQYNGYERVIAVVHRDYFSYHRMGNDTIGAFFPLVPTVVFVSDGVPWATPHELGHSYGFLDEYLLDANRNMIREGNPVQALINPQWVQHPSRIINGSCGAADCALGYMGAAPGVPYPTSPVPRWTTGSHFKDLFRQFRASPVDPPVILVTGTIREDGSATFESVYRNPTGVVSEAKPGNASIRVLDAQRNVLSEVTFSFDVTANIDPPISLPEVPFGFSLPDDQRAAFVQVVNEGAAVVEQSVTGALLKTAIESLPNDAFTSNAAERRNALLNKVAAFERQVLFAAGNGARNNLRNDIRKSLESWLAPSFSPQSPLEYSKTSLLALVDEILSRLN